MQHPSSGARPTLRIAAVLVVALVAGILAPWSGSRSPVVHSQAALGSGQPADVSAQAARGESEPSLAYNVKGIGDADSIGYLVQRAVVESAPSGVVPANAYGTALKQAAAVKALGQHAKNRHPWRPYGRGPLHADEKGYTSVSGLGLANLSGRITDLAWVPLRDKYHPGLLLASVSYGGVWKSMDSGKTWKRISGGLPTQTIGSVNYTSAHGGTIVAITGDAAWGRYSRQGMGAFYTTDMGRHWHRSKGVPLGLFGFNVATERSHPNRVYVATGGGLFRSADGGKTFVNVKLPTGPCAGKSIHVKGCLLANQVSDVVAQAPLGSPKVKGGKMVAVVGWREGNRKNPDGTVQSPNNGIYVSDDGKPGTWKYLGSPPGFAPKDNIGRVELGAAMGGKQDHNYLYAVVQDAVKMRGEPGIDIGAHKNPEPTVLNGIYVSPDFGQTWTEMESAEELQQPGTGSALAVTAQALSNYGPGVQSWYNEWIQPDPTTQTGGIPNRLLFGLEEIWQNENTNQPMNGPTSFKVVGRYFAGDTCLFLSGIPACPTDRGDPLSFTRTTHPDQHAAVFVIHKNGDSTLVAGNDGGVYSQTVKPGGEYDNQHWGKGDNATLRTLLAYDAMRARNGITWFGLQDNGTAKIQNVRDKDGKVVSRQRQIEAFGGDGFFVAVNPIHSKIAYEEYVGGSMSATADGGKSWAGMNPPITGAQFSNQFVMDPRDYDHVMTAGREVVETGSGAGTGSVDWAKVFDLGTAKHPGSADAAAAADDPANSMTAIDMVGRSAYVGFCGVCDVLDNPNPFKSGLATNVGGTKPPKSFTPQGWHIVKTQGLPNRYITTISVNPKKATSILVGLGGYSRRWTPPGSLDAGKNKNAGRGHLFVSRDAGKHFRNISANLPNIPVNWVERRGKQIIVATDVGVFISRPRVNCRHPASKRCRKFEVLGRGLPRVPIMTVRKAPTNPNVLTAATWGRGVLTYRFGPDVPYKPPPPPPPPAPFGGVKVVGPYTFEATAEGWTTKGNVDPQSQWRREPPGDNSTQAFNIQPKYQDDATAILQSPKITLPSGRHTIEVSWSEKRDTEACCDYLSLDWSSNGYVWHNVRSVAGQNPDYPGFTKVTSDKFVADGGDFYIRFRLTADQLVFMTGAGIDNVEVKR